MALTRFEYVKKFESDEHCLPNCWIVVRLDGRSFHRFSEEHGFAKPNDKRSLDLMLKSAESAMAEFKEIVAAYGESDEFSFVFGRKTSLYGRRRSKLLSAVCSHFTASYVFYWKDFFGDVPMKYPPSFDGRVVLYPTTQNLRDYLSWRQADCHINNLYNTTFWALVQQGGLNRREAEERIRHTVSSEKNEILYSEFNMNYNNEPEQFRKGSVIVKNIASKEEKHKKGNGLLTLHCDIIGNKFWEENAHLLLDD